MPSTFPLSHDPIAELAARQAAELLRLDFHRDAPDDAWLEARGYECALHVFGERGTAAWRCMLLRCGDEFTLAIGGTIDPKELVTNHSVLYNRLPSQLSKVLDFYEQCRAYIAEYAPDASSLTLFGHSMGGLLAQLISEGDIGQVKERVIAVDAPAAEALLEKQGKSPEEVAALAARCTEIVVSLGHGLGNIVNAAGGEHIAERIVIASPERVGGVSLEAATVEHHRAHRIAELLETPERHCALTNPATLHGALGWPKNLAEAYGAWYKHLGEQIDIAGHIKRFAQEALNLVLGGQEAPAREAGWAEATGTHAAHRGSSGGRHLH